MIPVNPGNLLPFYDQAYGAADRRWQRHRLPGQDVTPYGLPCPRFRLVPFQLSFAVAGMAVTSWALVNPEDDTETVVLDETLLDVQNDGATRSWVTWYADQNLDVIPDCGYWYVVLNLGEVGTFVSEVLDCRNFCGFEVTGMEIRPDNCLEDAGNLSFALDAVIQAGDATTYIIQRFAASVWTTIATDDSVAVIELASAESIQYRIVVTTECGLVVTKTYTATWTEGDACATLLLTLNSTVTDESDILTTGPVWRLSFSNSIDKGSVLYQNDYEQYLYLPTVIWDVPEVEREIDITVDGNGGETRRFTRTVERRGFETPDIPDYVIGWLTKAGDLDTILFEDAKLDNAAVNVEFSVENLTFESPERQGTALNIGRFYFNVEAEAFSGCQENFELA